MKRNYLELEHTDRISSKLDIYSNCRKLLRELNRADYFFFAINVFGQQIFKTEGVKALNPNSAGLLNVD